MSNTARDFTYLPAANTEGPEDRFDAEGKDSAGRSMTTGYKHSWLGNWVVDKADGYRPTIVFNLCVNQFNLPSRGWALPNCQRYWVAKPGYAECLPERSEE